MRIVCQDTICQCRLKQLKGFWLAIAQHNYAHAVPSTRVEVREKIVGKDTAIPHI